MSSCAALLIRHITKSDPSKKSSSPSPSPAPAPAPAPEPASLKGTLEHWTPYSINHRDNIYMERQHVDCQDHAMRGFRLIPNWDCDGDTTCKSQVSEAERNTTHAQAVKVNDKSTAIRYHYKCDVNKQSNVTDKNTDWVSNPDLDVTYAYGKSDNLTVDCDNKPITYYELQTDPDRDWDHRVHTKLQISISYPTTFMTLLIYTHLGLDVGYEGAINDKSRGTPYIDMNQAGLLFVIRCNGEWDVKGAYIQIF